jgi:hypothetical protein
MGLHIEKLRSQVRIAVPFEEDRIPRTAGGPSERSPMLAAAPSDGRGLDETTRAQVERMLGRGFEDVRVHSGPQAQRAARRMEARAFQLGPDVYFREGHFSPQSPEGMGLLLHELTHVVQQGASRPRADLEAEAERVERVYRKRSGRTPEKIDLSEEIEPQRPGAPRETAPAVPLTAPQGGPSGAATPRRRGRPRRPSARELAERVMERMKREDLIEEERQGRGGLGRVT